MTKKIIPFPACCCAPPCCPGCSRCTLPATLHAWLQTNCGSYEITLARIDYKCCGIMGTYNCAYPDGDSRGNPYLANSCYEWVGTFRDVNCGVPMGEWDCSGEHQPCLFVVFSLLEPCDTAQVAVSGSSCDALSEPLYLASHLVDCNALFTLDADIGFANCEGGRLTISE